MTSNPKPVYAAELYFQAETIDNNQTIQLKLHNIGQTDTAEDLFYYVTEGPSDPLACRYSSLRVMDDDAIFEAKLKAMQ
jgi:hypothetical protein